MSKYREQIDHLRGRVSSSAPGGSHAPDRRTGGSGGGAALAIRAPCSWQAASQGSETAAEACRQAVAGPARGDRSRPAGSRASAACQCHSGAHSRARPLHAPSKRQASVGLECELTCRKRDVSKSLRQKRGWPMAGDTRGPIRRTLSRRRERGPVDVRRGLRHSSCAASRHDSQSGD